MVHDAAAQGFERNAQTYKKVRPSYHPKLIARIAGLCGEGLVADIGAGTGIFTAQLVDVGVRVVPIEPVEAMRSALATALPEVSVLPGTSENTLLGDHSVDVVIAAQAFHWFDPLPTMDELARVLQPGGQLICAWNVRDEDVPWVAKYTEVVDCYAKDAPRYRSMAWRRAIEADSRFTFVEEWGIDNPQPSSSEGAIDRALSTSFIAALPHNEQLRVAEQIRSVVAGLGDEFDYPYRSEMQVWQKH